MKVYRVYREGSISPLATETSLWMLLRFIAYLFRNDSYDSLTITKEIK